MKRRQLIKLGVSSTAAFISKVGYAQPSSKSGNTVLWGQIATLSGSLGLSNAEFNIGAQACIKEANESRWLPGTQIQLISKDDSANFASVPGLVREILQRDISCFFGCGGTQTIQAMLPILTESQTPLIGPTSNNENLRAYHPWMIHTRASSSNEIQKIVDHIAVLNVERLAFVTSKNPWGISAQRSFEMAAKDRLANRWKLFVLGDDADAPSRIIDELQRYQPTSVISVAANGRGIEYFKKLVATLKVQTYTVSNIGSLATLQTLGDAAKGLIITQTMPSPTKIQLPIVRAYQNAMKRANQKDFTYTSLDGYITARIAVEAFKRSGNEISKTRILRSFLTMKPLNLGGYEVNYFPGETGGSSAVSLSYFDGRTFRT
jgi:branched-chain amino acid transport system substrate-binding protein